MKLIKGNCIEVLKTLEENSVDSVVTDPPYEIGFMGKSWDSSGIANNPEMWKECLRVLKPGGYLLSFSATRTYHRMAVGIEDAGFEIRDMIEWVYGSGFPKSLNIGKAVDKLDAKDIRRQRDLSFTAWMRSTGITAKQINEATESCMGSHYLTDKEQPAVATLDMFEKIKNLLPAPPPDIMQLMKERTVESENFKKREVVGEKETKDFSHHKGSMMGKETTIDNKTQITTIIDTKGTSEWEGWGTALKPAHEPICMARKPLAEKTVAKNCLKYGTGGINIDESRVGIDINDSNQRPNGSGTNSAIWGNSEHKWENTLDMNKGRFPANLIHDNSEEVRECFPETNGGNARTGKKGGSGFGFFDNEKTKNTEGTWHGGSGNASRFFKSIIYQSKPSKKERNAGCEGLEEKETPYGSGGGAMPSGNDNPNKTTSRNNHPTVKPIALMEYLIKMVTPKGGVVLDPFMGSGTTGCASVKNGFDFIGIDLEEEYIKIATARINHYKIF